jgi:ribosomal protein L16 Arg81 hydroxylase
LIVDSVHELLPPVKSVSRALTAIFGEDVRINLYLGGKESAGFPIHWDIDEILIVQVWGRKHWEVYPSSKKYPLPEDKALDYDIPGNMIWKGVLEEGNLIHVPRGFWHRAWTTDSLSCHLTVTIPACTGLDLLRFALERCGGIEELRKNIPGSGDFLQRRDLLMQRLLEVMQGIDEKDFRQQRLRRLPGDSYLLPNDLTE